VLFDIFDFNDDGVITAGDVHVGLAEALDELFPGVYTMIT